MVMIAPADTDAELCDRVRAGDRAAAEQLVRRHEGLVKRAALQRVSARHPDADDLIQLGRLALLRAAAGYDPAGGSKFPSYAYQAVAWAAGSHLDRARRDTTLDDPAPLDNLADPRPAPGDGPPPPAGAPGWLTLALLRLPADQGRVVRLVYGLDPPGPVGVPEAARLLGMTRDACHGLHTRALATLRRVAARG